MKILVVIALCIASVACQSMASNRKKELTDFEDYNRKNLLDEDDDIRKSLEAKAGITGHKLTHNLMRNVLNSRVSSPNAEEDVFSPIAAAWIAICKVILLAGNQIQPRELRPLRMQQLPFETEKDRMFANRPISHRMDYAPRGYTKPTGRGVSLTEMLPFGPEHGDAALRTGDDDVNVQLTLRGDPFVFFNSTYDKVWINNNGALSFLKEVRDFTPTCGALSAPMIIPYWTDVHTGNGGKVYYRQSTDSSLLQKVTVDLKKAFPNSRNLDLKWALVATWADVAFYGASTSSSSCPGKSLRNTLQVVIVRDAIQSFVLFYYNKLEWTTGAHPSSGGNSCTGLGGTPAKAGFDYGDGHTFVNLPSSCSNEVSKLTQNSNFLEPGKWAFRVTEVVEDTCEIPKCVQGKDYYVNPFSCRTYYHCSNGVQILRDCSANLVWNAEKDTCDWPASYPCEPICQ